MQYKKLYHYNHKEKGQRGNGGSASSYNGVQGHVGGGRLKDTAPSVVIPSVRTSPHRKKKKKITSHYLKPFNLHLRFF